ncbi:DNA primase family protein [Fundidesulfovibrio terrae]|uniref:DNA primase family protein n=1 Tax=Fundidesulfovibrio terrae TaxID=2922866 RepID=UPI001FAE98FE|nr:DNA primase family protein [Fundidesulfovibrio terrae]
MIGPQAQLTVFTSTRPAQLSKGFKLGEDGNLVKSNGGRMAEGDSKTVAVTPLEFTELLKNLKPSQALGFGLGPEQFCFIGTQGYLQPGQVTRQKENFKWPDGPGVMMTDYDPPKDGSTPWSAERLLEAFTSVAPGLVKAPLVVTASVSSHIYTQTGECLKGPGGLRAYLFVRDATDIPRAGQVLHDRLWLAGYGRYDVSESGALLERSCTDTAVWSPERLDFAGAAVLGPGLVQKKPEPIIIDSDAEFLDTRAAFHDLTPEEKKKLALLKQHAKEVVRDKMDAKKEAWTATRMKEVRVKNPAKSEPEFAIIEELFRRSLENGKLCEDQEIHLHNGPTVTVRDILAEPAKFHDKRCADPMEPGYNNDPDIGWICAKDGKPPVIFSHAHGKKKYTLGTDKQAKKSPMNREEASGIRQELEARIKDTEDFDELLGPVAEAIAKSGLPVPDVEYLLKLIKKRTGTSLHDLRAAVRLARASGGDSDGDKFNHMETALRVIESYGEGNLLHAQDFFWKWDLAGVWRKMDDLEIKKKVHRVAEVDDLTASIVDSVFKLAVNETFRPGHAFDAIQDAVNVRNGELYWEGNRWELRPHCRESYRTTQIPVAYDPQAAAPRFLQFLDEIFRDDPDKKDKKRLVLECMGYSLMATCRFEKFMLLIGPGANGKSVLLAVLAALVGPKQVAAVQPSQFDNRFQRAHLHGRLVNIVTEIAEGHEMADAQLKAIVSGELTTAEHKMRPPFDFNPFCTCWFGTNHMPNTRDFSDALFRRANILTFNRTFQEEEQDRQLVEKLKSELPGIMAMALEALAEVIQRGEFTRTESCEAAKKEWRLDSDQVAAFVEDQCVLEPGLHTPSGYIYTDYKSWAEEAGGGPLLGRKKFTSRLQRLGVQLHKSTGGVRMLAGIALKFAKGRPQ